MGSHVTLAFYKNEHFSYQEAKKSKAVYSVRLDYGEAYQGLAQTAVWDALEIINETKNCFGLKDEPLSFVLLNKDGEIVDAM
jgi:hypothetical protein